MSIMNMTEAAMELVIMVVKSIYMCSFCQFFEELKITIQDHKSGHFIAPVKAEKPRCSKCCYCTFHPTTPGSTR
jgi:hypothetical protein